jgi:hypothetical protein
MLTLPPEIIAQIVLFLPLLEVTRWLPLLCKGAGVLLTDLVLPNVEVFEVGDDLQIGINGPALQMLSRLRSVRKVVLAGDQSLELDPVVVVHLATHCRNISWLDLEECILIDDDCMKSVCERLGDGLERLNLTNCYRIGSASLHAMGACCSNLRHLTLIRCFTMEDSGLADLAAGCRNLTYVNLIGCILITDEGLRSLGALSKLQHLLLFRCKGVTDAGLHALGAGCPELKHINLYGLSNVTDVGVTALITKCPRLDHLRLHDMDLLTDASIDAMLPLRCPQMRRLAVGLCPGITDMALFGLEIANKTLVLETTQERTRF